MTCVMGLDPSLTGCALVVMGETGFVKATARFSSKPSGPQVHKRIERFLGLCRDVMDVVAICRPDCVMIEGYSMGSKGSGQIDRFEFGGILRRCLTEQVDLIYEVPPLSLKKFVLGSLNKANMAGKTAMIAAITKNFDVQYETDDEYDAFALAVFGLTLMKWRPPANQSQADCVQKVLSGPQKKGRKKHDD